MYIDYNPGMEPTDEAELARLMAIHERAVEWEAEARRAIYAFLQLKLLAGRRGTRKELMRLTGWSPAQMDNIKAGRWSRDSRKNPPENT